MILSATDITEQIAFPLIVGDESFELAAPPNRDGSPGTVVLHGGTEGFGGRVWAAAQVRTADGPGLRFTLTSPDGDQGFPGEMTVAATYHWTDDFRLLVDYEASTSRPTVINLTQHSYFNLAGAGNGDILQHTLHIAADFFTFALPDNRPTGEIRSARGTPFDFTEAKPNACRVAESCGVSIDNSRTAASTPFTQKLALVRARH